MKKLLLLAMVTLALLASAARAANGKWEIAAVGAWTCSIQDNQKCYMTVPQFPSLFPNFGTGANIASGGGSFIETDAAVVMAQDANQNLRFASDRLLPLGFDSSKEWITGISGQDFEPSCGVGEALATLTTGDGDSYNLVYARVGATALIALIGPGANEPAAREVLLGAFLFEPKTTTDDLIMRCADVLGTGAANHPLTVNFTGGGIILEVSTTDENKGGSDAPPPIF